LIPQKQFLIGIIIKNLLKKDFLDCNRIKEQEVKRLRKNIVLLDLICFVIFPLAVWNVSKDYIDDYYAMLISSVPGIIYSIYRFYELKRIHITGLFIIGNLIINTLIDVFAGSALQMLWNHVFYDYALASFFLLTIVIISVIYINPT
jgi:hypothetical protein